MPMLLDPSTTAAYDVLPLGVAIIDLNGTIEYCNSAHACLYGYTTTEMVGLSVAELIADPAQAEAFPRFLMDHASGKRSPIPFESTMKNSGGKTFPIRVQWHHWIGESDCISGFVGIVREVRDEQAKLDRLSAEQDRLYLNIMGAELGTWDWNIVTGDVTFNERWANMLGYHLEEIDPHVRVWETLLHPEDKAWVMMVLEDHLTGITDVYETEHRLRHKDGHWVWVMDKGQVFERDEAGKPVRACGVHLDISERKKAEALLRSEMRFNESLVTTANTIILVLTPTGLIQYFNPYFESITRHRLKDTKGLDWIDTFIPEEERCAVRTLFRSAIGECSTKGSISTVLAADGTRLQIEWFDTCIRDDDGKVTGLLATGQDVTERMEAQAFIQRAHRELETQVAERTHDLKAALAEARINADRYLALADQLPFGVATVDRNLRVITANQLARRWWPSFEGGREGPFCYQSLFCPAGCAEHRDCPVRRTIQHGTVDVTKYHSNSKEAASALRIITIPVSQSESSESQAILLIEDITAEEAENESLLARLHAAEDRLDLPDQDHLCQLLGTSSLMQQLYREIRTAAAHERIVLLQGDTGTGKELAAQAIHELRGLGDLIAVNCGNIAESLLESELFGHARGAFTGATAEKLGLFEIAGEGVVFLDEIEAAPPQLQTALLRVLDSREVVRVGEAKPIPIRAKIIFASNHSLEEMVERGLFRKDLFHRLCETVILLPPLRQRTSDIPLLTEAFFTEFKLPSQRFARKLSPRSIEILSAYDWPGNVRELKNLAFTLAQNARDPLVWPADLPAWLTTHQQTFSTLADRERQALKEAMDASSGNKSQAAALLGVSRKQIYALLRKHSID